MADNIELNLGSGGKTIATDDDGTAHHQQVKVEFGADGTQTPVDASNPLPVVADAGTNLNTSLLALEGGGNLATLAGAVSGNEVQVDIVSSPGALETGGNLATLAGAVSGNEVQVDIVSSPGALETGGNLATLVSGQSTVIGHIDGLEGALAVANAWLSSISTTLASSMNNYRNLDVDESEDAVSATPCALFWIHAMNMGSAPRYLKLYNATVATVVVGTTVPIFTFPLPSPGDSNGAGFALNLQLRSGLIFPTALTIAATTGVADADVGAPGANEVIVNLGWGT